MDFQNNIFYLAYPISYCCLQITLANSFDPDQIMTGNSTKFLVQLCKFNNLVEHFAFFSNARIFHHEASNDPDLTGKIPRLIRDFIKNTSRFVGFLAASDLLL